MWQAQASTHFQYLKSSNTVCNSLFHGMTGSRACLWNWRWWKSHLIFIEGYSNQYDRRGSIGGRFRPSTQPEWPIIQKPHWRKWRPNTQPAPSQQQPPLPNTNTPAQAFSVPEVAKFFRRGRSESSRRSLGYWRECRREVYSTWKCRACHTAVADNMMPAGSVLTEVDWSRLQLTIVSHGA